MKGKKAKEKAEKEFQRIAVAYEVDKNCLQCFNNIDVAVLIHPDSER